MSPMSGNFELDMALELETTTEVTIEPTLQENAKIHDYAFGIISSDSKGMTSVVSISEPYQKFSTGSSPNDDFNSSGFHSWSMSSYQSLYQAELNEEEEDIEGNLGNDDDQFEEDANNNVEPNGSLVRGKRRNSLKMDANEVEDTQKRVSSSPRKIPGATSRRRRWSTSSIFGGKSSPPARVFAVDPDMPVSVSPTESWFSSFAQIPDKIRQHMADRNRFDVSSVPREQLKQLHCY